MTKNVYTIYHDRDYILHCGYKPLEVVKPSASWFTISQTARALNLPIERVHAFRIAPNCWEFFTRGDISEGYGQKPLSATR